MRLNSINIKNFRVIRSVNFDFDDQVIGIIGQNGSGKSSIIEAISWALYGNQAARSGKDEIKSEFANPQDNCEVSLSFSINGEKYQVLRRLIGKKEHAEVQLFRGDDSESVGVKETQKYVGELLGLDWKGFNTSFLARQQELNALSDLRPKERQNHLAGMLGIEKVDKAITRVKEDIKRYKDRIMLLENQIGESDQLEKRIADLSRKSAELKQNQGKLQAELASTEQRLKEKADTYQKFQDAKSEWVKFTAQIEAANETLKLQKNNLENYIKEKEDLKKLFIKAEKIRLEVAELAWFKQNLEELKKAKNQFDVIQQSQERINEQTSKKINITSELIRSTENLRNYNSQLSDIPDHVELLSQTCRKELEEKREEYSDQKIKVETIKSQIDILKQQMQDIEQFGPESVCDRCQRPLGDDLPDIKKHLNEELNKLIAQNETESLRLGELKKIGLEFKSKAENLEISFNLSKELKIKLSSAEREKANYIQQLQDIEGSIERDKKQIEKFDGIKFDEKEFNDLSSQIKILEASKEELNHFQGKLTRTPIVIEEINKVNARMKNIEQELSTLQEKLVKTAFSESSFKSIKEEFEIAQNEMDTAKSLIVAVNSEIDLTNKSLEYETERLGQLQKIASQLDEYRDNQYYSQKLSLLFSQFREHLVSRIRPTLADFSSRLLEEMTEGRYSMVELDEDYNLRLMDSGNFYGIDRYSGGEKDLANLCLRLSISLALTESAGLDRSFIILDEIFGSQDDNRKELILKALANLKHRFPQILLITHVEDIRDRVDALIELERLPSGWSEIKILGQVQN